MESILSEPLLWVAIAFIAFSAFVTFFANRYERCAPNEVLIVSGRSATYETPDAAIKKSFKIYQGGGTFVLPLRERTDRLSLELMTVEIKTPEFFTKFGVPIMVDSIAQIKVKSEDPVAVITAAEMFLSKTREEMNEVALQMMSGHLRAVISTMPFEEIHANPEAFAQAVQRLSGEDLANMGIRVVSFTIREVKDPSGYLQAISRPKMAEVQKDAAVGEAGAKRDARIGEAEAERTATVVASTARQESETARIAAERVISEIEKDKEVQLAKFESEKATAKATADSAYDLEKSKRRQLLVEEQLGISLIEKRKQIEIEESEIKRRELELAHTITKPAEAERAKIETLAAAGRVRRKAEAEAEAEHSRLNGLAAADVVRAQGEAEAQAIRMTALAEAEGMRAKELAVAEGRRATLLAEAEGMKQKAEAWKQYNEAAISQMLVERLPEIAAAVASPLSKIDRIVMINNQGADGGTGVEQVTRSVTKVLAQIPEIAETIAGINLTDLASRLPGLNTSSESAQDVAEPAEDSASTAAEPADPAPEASGD